MEPWHINAGQQIVVKTVDNYHIKLFPFLFSIFAFISFVLLSE